MTSEYTEQDRANEGCCWDYVRQLCKGGGCLCNCHATNEEILLSDRARLRRQVDTLTEQLEAVTAERDALRKTIAALIRTFVSTHGLSFVQANAQEPSNRRISLMMEWGTVRAAVSAWEQERAALAARGGEAS